MKLNINKPLAFFDLETTGLSIAKDKIVEISVIKVMPNGEELELTQRLNPEMKIPQEVSDIHGIYDKDVKDMPTFKEFAPKLLEFFKDCDLAGYNSNKFDVPLLVEEFLNINIDFEVDKRKRVDVQNIFHKMEPRTLVGAYKFYCQKDLTNAHSASADTIATKEVLEAQLDLYNNIEYTDREGNTSVPVVNSVKELSEFSLQIKNADLVGHIAFNKQGEEVFNFGKHKNKKVEDVFAKEPSYFDWMMKADFPMSTKKVLKQIRLRSFGK